MPSPLESIVVLETIMRPPSDVEAGVLGSAGSNIVDLSVMGIWVWGCRSEPIACAHRSGPARFAVFSGLMRTKS